MVKIRGGRGNNTTVAELTSELFSVKRVGNCIHEVHENGETIFRSAMAPGDVEGGRYQSDESSLG